MLFRSLFAAALAATTTMAASLQAVTGFGTNPSQIQMYIYVPDKLATNPAIVVAVSGTPLDRYQSVGRGRGGV